MSWYENHVLPHMINLACSSKYNRKQREKVVPHAAGEVLEIGFGSGLNLPHYAPHRVSKIWALEPSEGMRRKAAKIVKQSDIDLEFIDLPGEEIPLPDESVDTVLMTYTLCTIPDAVAALKGMRRVLRPGGRMLFCEHGAAPDAGVARWQDRLNPAWGKIAGGCNINRDIPALIRAGGFDITSDEHMYIPGPKILCFNYWGTAVPAG